MNQGFSIIPRKKKGNESMSALLNPRKHFQESISKNLKAALGSVAEYKLIPQRKELSLRD